MLKVDKKRYAWIGIDDYISSCVFQSKDDALNDWVKSVNAKPGDKVYLGHPKFYFPVVDAFAVVENIQNQACDDTYGYSDEQDYLAKVGKTRLEALEKALTKTFREWEEKNKLNQQIIVVDCDYKYELQESGGFIKCL